MGKGRSPSLGDNGLLAAIMAVAKTIFAPVDASTGESWGEGPHRIALRAFSIEKNLENKDLAGGLESLSSRPESSREAVESVSEALAARDSKDSWIDAA